MHVPFPGAAERLLRPVLDHVPATVERVMRAETAVHDFSVRRSVFLLRLSLGFVFIVFGVLKFFPGLSPAQQIAEQTTAVLTFHLVPVSGLLLVVAFVEVLAGVLLIQGRYMRAVVWLLLFEMVAILSPLVTLPGELFNGPHHLPSLLGQYILKDFVLLSGVLVLAAHTRKGQIVVPGAQAVGVPPGTTPIVAAAPAAVPIAAAGPAPTPAGGISSAPVAAAVPATPLMRSVNAVPAREERPARTSPVLTATAFVAVGLLALRSRAILPNPSR